MVCSDDIVCNSEKARTNKTLIGAIKNSNIVVTDDAHDPEVIYSSLTMWEALAPAQQRLEPLQ